MLAMYQFVRAFDFLVMLVLSNVIHDFDVTRVPIVDKPDAIR